MQDLERLAKHFETKYGFQCYQIAIHRDEGHIDDNGEKVINHHAHLEFITLDKESGKSLFRAELQKPKDLRQIQTEVAEILQMEWGQDKRISKRERIEPRKYGAMKEKEREALRKLLDFYDEILGIDTKGLSITEAQQAHKNLVKKTQEKNILKGIDNI